MVDLRLAAQKVDTHELQKKAEFLNKLDKALFVASGQALSMFSPATWSRCF